MSSKTTRTCSAFRPRRIARFGISDEGVPHAIAKRCLSGSQRRQLHSWGRGVRRGRWDAPVARPGGANRRLQVSCSLKVPQRLARAGPRCPGGGGVPPPDSLSRSRRVSRAPSLSPCLFSPLSAPPERALLGILRPEALQAARVFFFFCESSRGRRPRVSFTPRWWPLSLSWMPATRRCAGRDSHPTEAGVQVDWTELPPEIMVNAFEHIDAVRDLTRLAEVCKAWSTVSADTPWQGRLLRDFPHLKQVADLHGSPPVATSCLEIYKDQYNAERNAERIADARSERRNGGRAALRAPLMPLPAARTFSCWTSSTS